MIMGKSVIAESTPGFVGVYAGVLSSPQVREAVEDSDCILNLGAMLTDLNTGIFTAQLEPSRVIMASSETVTIRRHRQRVNMTMPIAKFLMSLRCPFDANTWNQRAGSVP